MDEYLDELQEQVEKLLGLLKDRQSGLVSWHMLLYNRIFAISTVFDKMILDKEDDKK